MAQKYLWRTPQDMTIIKVFNDVNQVFSRNRLSCLRMIFSKTFGYALRGVLFVAIESEKRPRVQLDEIAEQLSVPRHFMGNVMKKLVKEGVLNSMKGPFGGFGINETTSRLTLFKLMEMTGEVEDFDACVLRLRKCGATNPCPMHNQVVSLRVKWQGILDSTTISDLLKDSDEDFLKSISAN